MLNRPGSRLAACMAIVSVSLAREAPVFAQDGGGLSCTSSFDCAPPTPYCDDVTNACVECLDNRNCPPERVCDLGQGRCVSCVTDADCPPRYPYCNAQTQECVECLADANCGTLGIACADGVCGSCGDGICGPYESFTFYSDNACREDCRSLCPTRDLGSSLGTFTEPLGWRNMLLYGCADSEAPDVSIAWEAPYAGRFIISFAGSPENTALTQFGGTCDTFEQSGSSCSTGVEQFDWSFDAGQGEQFLFFLEATRGSGNFVFTVSADTAPPPGCDASGCPDSGSGGAGGTAGGDAGLTACETYALGSSYPCEALRCACDHCAEYFDNCAEIPGCEDIQACMATNDCVGVECYNSGACRNVVDEHFGISGTPFDTASALQSCSLQFDCALPCAVEAGAPDAGREASAPEPTDAASDSGTCEPDEMRSCSCDGGTTGTQRCADGGDFSPCSCEEATTSAQGGSCACRATGAPERWPSSAASVFSLAILLASMRRRARRNEVRR